MPGSLVSVDITDGIAIVQLQNGKVNPLSKALLEQLHASLQSLTADQRLGCVIIRGSDKAFSAGVDIKELRAKDFVEGFTEDFLRAFADGIHRIRVPVIAAVNGYTLGGGFELAMLCDIIYAGESATFGQPEIKIGTIPGGGGTQRLVRAIGKAKAMDLILTGRTVTSQEALQWGVISRVVPDSEVFNTALESAKLIAGYSRPAVMMAKEAASAAEEMSLSQGLLFERRLYHATFGLEDFKEGMAAFVEKRTPQFHHK